MRDDGSSDVADIESESAVSLSLRLLSAIKSTPAGMFYHILRGIKHRQYGDESLSGDVTS